MAADITTGLAALHRFEEASGDALDASGNSLTLTETSGTIATITGPNGVATARDFESGDTEYFARASSGAMAAGTGSWLKAGWFYGESFPANAVICHEGWQAAGSTNRSHVIYCPSNASIRLTIGVGTGNVDHAHTQTFSTGRWYFGAFGYDDDNNLLFIEIDLGTPTTVSQATAPNASTGPIEFGASSGQALYWDGGLANWRTIVGRFPSKEDRHAMRLERYAVRTFYADPNAAGSNNGSSAANAWTSLASAVASTGMRPDDQLHLNAISSAPYVGGQHFNVYWGIDLLCDGADGWNATNGRLMSTATGPTSNVFSQTVASKPSHVVWDWQADSTGSVTGWAYDEWDEYLLDRWNVSAAMRPAYYGFLEEDTGAPTTPAEGKWGHNGTTLYINPPGSPDQATVRTKARYCLAGTHGIGLIGCSKGTFTGPATFDLYPSTANSEYGLFANGQDMTVEDVNVRAGGWHAVGFAGGSPAGGPRNTLRNIVVNGVTGDEASAGSVNGCVFYQPSTATEFGGHLAEDIVLIAPPRFLHTGAPATTNWSPQPCLVHSDPGVTTMSATWRRVLCIDKTDELEAFHTITNANAGSSSLAQGTIGDVFDYSTYPQLIQDSYFRGRLIPAPAGLTSFENCFFDRHNCGRSNLAACTAAAVTGAIAFKDCFFILGDHSNSFFDSFAAADALIFDGCKFLMQASTSKASLVGYLSAGTGTNRVRFLGCQFETADSSKLHGVLKGNSTAFDANFNDIFSDGNNVFGTGVVPAYNSDGSTSRDIAWWKANIEGGSTDVQRSLGWGSTEEQKVETLRQWWATGIAPGGQYKGPIFSPSLPATFSPSNPPLILAGG